MVKRLQLMTLWLICVSLLAACSPSVAGTPITDEEFDAAVEEAHQTLSTLREALLSPRSSYDFIGLKVRFIGESEYEDTWTQPVDYFNGYFTVRMIDGVLLDPGLNTERMVIVPLKRVLDWVIVKDDGTLIGGYTIKLTYEHMTPEEKKEFLRATGYKMRSP